MGQRTPKQRYLTSDGVDLSVVEIPSRAMAEVFGIDPDAPFPEALKLALQGREAFNSEVWVEQADSPAWVLLAYEMWLTRDAEDEEELQHIQPNRSET